MQTSFEVSFPASGSADVSVGALIQALELVSDRLTRAAGEDDELISACSLVRRVVYAITFSHSDQYSREPEQIPMARRRSHAKRHGRLDLARQKLSADEASAILRSYGVNLSAKTLANRRHAGGGPNYEKLYSGAVRYDRNDLIAFAAKQRATHGDSTSNQKPV